jgi:hypothetical protein
MLPVKEVIASAIRSWSEDEATSAERLCLRALMFLLSASLSCFGWGGGTTGAAMFHLDPGCCDNDQTLRRASIIRISGNGASGKPGAVHSFEDGLFVSG